MSYKICAEFEILSQENGIFFLRNNGNRQILMINSTGWFILNNINGKTKNEIINILLQEISKSNIEKENVYKEVDKYIDNLILYGFLKENT